MHQSHLLASAMAFLLLSSPAAWSDAPKKAAAKPVDKAAPKAALKGAPLVPTAEPFEGTVIAEGLSAPWDMVWGPDHQIWVTEREAARITRIDPRTGEKKVVGTVPDVKIGPQHEGVLGIALDPKLGAAEDNNFVYIAHTYMDGDSEHARIVRFRYDPGTQQLSDPKVILAAMPAGDDHNGGRLRFGPDGKLYYSIGEQGHNQGGNVCRPIDAQRLPTQDELDRGDHAAYAGKILRFNADGSIPDDNPTIRGVKSHIYTYGHRNPQGLVFVEDVLFETEHGPSSDDELNRIEAGGNYGWPYVAGYQDDEGYVYGNWSAAPDCETIAKRYFPTDIPDSVPQQKESEWKADHFHAPLKTFYTVRGDYTFHDQRCGDTTYLCWPTIAPSSVTYYPADGPIPGWGNSLLVTSLKNGALYRVPLNADAKNVQGDVVKYFHTPNRYRAALVSPDGKTVYVATDVRGNVMNEDNKPVSEMKNPGSIIAFTYAGKGAEAIPNTKDHPAPSRK